MIGALEAHHVLAASVGARELDDGVVGIGAGVAEHDLLGARARRNLAQLLHELNLRRVIHVCRRVMNQLLRLLRDGIHHAGVTMAHVGCRRARQKIDVAVAVHVVEHGAFAVVDNHVVVRDASRGSIILLLLLHHLLRKLLLSIRHDVPLFSCSLRRPCVRATWASAPNLFRSPHSPLGRKQARPIAKALWQPASAPHAQRRGRRIHRADLISLYSYQGKF